MNKVDAIRHEIPSEDLTSQVDSQSKNNPFFRLGLKAKFFWSVMLLISLLALVLTAISIFQLRNSMERDLRTVGINTVERISHEVELGIFTKNVEFIEPAIQKLAGIPNFLYVAIYDEGHSILSSKIHQQLFQETLKEIPSHVDIQLHDNSSSIWHEYQIDEQTVYEFWYPVTNTASSEDEDLLLDVDTIDSSHNHGKNIIGYIRYGVTLSEIDKSINTAIYTNLVVQVFFMIVAALLVFILVKRITTPLERLVTLSEAVTNGNLRKRTNINRQDEVGKLSRSFDRMINAVEERDAQLRKTHDELEIRVEERTKELSLTNKKLTAEIVDRTEAENSLARTAKDLSKKATELEKSNKDLDQFAYVAAHDLKAPLRAIANLSNWIEEDLGNNIDEDIKSNMLLLRGRVQRLENLIEGILQYSRLGGTTNTKIETIDIRTLIEEVVETIDPPKSFTINIEATSQTFECARILLEQVIANLVSNAFKYHDRKDGIINIAVLDENDLFKISVSDDGPGIDKKFHEKIFVIFQTLQARDSIESTGIGLTIVKKIIEEQGGEIRLKSEPGEGTTFYFTWPKKPKTHLVPE